MGFTRFDDELNFKPELESERPKDTTTTLASALTLPLPLPLTTTIEYYWKKLVLPLVRVVGIRTLLVSYLKNIPNLAPIEKGTTLDWTNLPEGGMRNGGTIVIGSSNNNGDGNPNSILYRWNDKIPGDVPMPSEVYSEALSILERER
mmetsp:Transcript_5644/g.12303  ORF Transcript_5644/g.12303 Transcript_5644/m.12303 type:complete len:147 (+) Transcript_5644:559-999(+)